MAQAKGVSEKPREFSAANRQAPIKKKSQKEKRVQERGAAEEPADCPEPAGLCGVVEENKWRISCFLAFIEHIFNDQYR